MKRRNYDYMSPMLRSCNCGIVDLSKVSVEQLQSDQRDHEFNCSANRRRKMDCRSNSSHVLRQELKNDCVEYSEPFLISTSK
jgi:hypothetical protein